MAKLIYLFVLLLLPITSKAMPALNDYAKFEITLEIPGKPTQKMYEELKLVDYDAPTKIFLMEKVTTLKGESSSENIGVKTEELLDDRLVKNIIELCPVGHGVNEDLVLNGQKLKTCRFESESNEGKSQRWFAPVPFGIIKEAVQLKNGAKLTKTMTEYTFGK